MSGQRASSADADDKLLGIELLRFASALAVLVFHFQHFAFVGLTQPGFTAEQQPFYGALKLLYVYGSYGVHVFWCISGFIFYWKYADKIAGAKVTAYSFFILRWSRLYPLHIVTLLFLVVAQMVYWSITGTHFVYAWNDLYHFVLQLFMASNWGLQAGDSFNGPIWSISIEVLVYCLFYACLRILSSSIFGLLAVWGIAALVIAFKLFTHPFFYCVVFFYTGCFTALAYGWARESLQRSRLLMVSALIAVVVMPVLAYKMSLRPHDCVFVFAPALILLCVHYISPGQRVGHLLVDAGNVTYASYLLHVPLQISVAIACQLLRVDVPWRSPLLFVTYMVVTLMLSLWCHSAFEMPMQNLLRRRFLRR